MKENGHFVTLSVSSDSGDSGRSSKSLARASGAIRNAQSQTSGGKQPPHSPASAKHQKVSIPLSRRPDCMYFVNGTCNKGENCIFRHNLLARAGSHDVCPNWIRYHSCDDQLCKKLHPKQTLKASLEEIEEFEQKQNKVQMQLKKQPVNTISVSIPLSAESTVPAIPLSPTEAKRPDCMFYVRGSCSKGDHCLFRHNDKAKNGSLEVCPRWTEEGRCDDPNCICLHPRPISHSSSAAPTNSTPWAKRPDCVYYLQGSCSKKENCLFRHSERTKNGSMEVCPNWVQYGQCNDPACNLFHPKNVATATATSHFHNDVIDAQSELSTVSKTSNSNDANSATSSYNSEDSVSSEESEVEFSPEYFTHILEITSSEDISEATLTQALEPLVKTKSVKFQEITPKKICGIFASPDYSLRALSSLPPNSKLTFTPFEEASAETHKFVLHSESGVVPECPSVIVKGKVKDGLLLELSSPNLSIIRYTLDGSDPTEKSQTYTIPFIAPYNAKVKAISYKPFWPKSKMTDFLVTDSSLLSTKDKFIFHDDETELPFGYSCDCTEKDSPRHLFAIHVHSDDVDPTGLEKNLAALKPLRSEFLAPVEKFVVDPYAIMYDCGNAVTLAKFVTEQNGAPITLAHRMLILKGIASGLDYLHGQSIVHGHLLPETVFVYPNLSVKLACFGLGAIADKPTQQSVPYASPERLEGSAASEADDIYAFGTIAYALIVSSVVFDELKVTERPRVVSQFFSQLSPPIGVPLGKEDDIVTALTPFHSMSPDELAPLSANGFMSSAFSRPSSLPSGISFEFDGLQQFPSESLGGSRHSLTFSSLTPLGHQQQYLSQLDDPVNAASVMGHEDEATGVRSGDEHNMNAVFEPTLSSLSLGAVGCNALDNNAGEKLSTSLALKGKAELCCENKRIDEPSAERALSGLMAHADCGDSKSLLAAYFIQGKRMRIPFLCEYGYGAIIERCWKQKPEKRPTAAKLLKLIKKYSTII